MNRRSEPTSGAITVRAVVTSLAPGLHVLAQSQPIPELRHRNVLFLTRHQETARQAIEALEAMDFDDDRLGTMVLGRGRSHASVDAEGVASHVAPRVVIGAVIGALLGALVIGGGALLLGASTGLVLGAAAGGALMVATFGATWVTFAGFGGTEAYGETFADDALAELAVVSVHTNDDDDARAATKYLAERDGELIVIDELGVRVAGG